MNENLVGRRDTKKERSDEKQLVKVGVYGGEERTRREVLMSEESARSEKRERRK